ncbi:VPS21, partial [Fragariocoptes setiger]
MAPKSLEAKVILIGSNGVGKSSIVTRYMKGRFTPTMSPTIGASFFKRNIVIEDYLVKMNIWDTAGQERFRAMSPIYYRNSNAAIVVYDLTSHESFLAVKEWIKELTVNIDGEVVLTIVGNKRDLPHRQVSLREGDLLARQYNAVHFEASALTSENIPDIFSSIGNRIIMNAGDNIVTQRLNKGYTSICEPPTIVRRTDWRCCG